MCGRGSRFRLEHGACHEQLSASSVAIDRPEEGYHCCDGLDRFVIWVALSAEASYMDTPGMLWTKQSEDGAYTKSRASAHAT